MFIISSLFGVQPAGFAQLIDVARMVFLEVFVKLRSGWADDERVLRSLGYE